MLCEVLRARDSQEPSHQTTPEGWKTWPSRMFGKCVVGNLSLGVHQWMSSVFWTEKQTLRREAFWEMMSKRSSNRRMLVLCDGEAKVMDKLSTYVAIRPLGTIT